MRATGVLPLHHAFALSGRVSYMLYTQGDALGYVLVGLSDRPPVRRGRILYGCLILFVTFVTFVTSHINTGDFSVFTPL